MNILSKNSHNGLDYKFAKAAYQWRWITSLAVLVSVVYIFMSGIEKVGHVTQSVLEISDISDGSGAIAPQMFDPSLSVWFDTGDATVKAYFDIEDQFIAEDYILLAFENRNDTFGVFSPESLSTIQRLSENLLSVPGIRHVRSLTYSPWIRWGEIGDGSTKENGLIISDLVQFPAKDLTKHDIIERMVAVLGAKRTADKIGERRLRQFLGENTDFNLFQGEPMLLDSIVNQDATATAIQIQITRPYIENLPSRSNQSENEHTTLSSKLHSIQYQRAALRGIEHFLNIERGLSVKTPEYNKTEKWISSLPEGEEKNELQYSLVDPTKNFTVNQHGETIKKYHTYRQLHDGSYVAGSSPQIRAPTDFSPQALSPYTFKLGGVPILERNFELVGSADSKFLPLMFLVIIIALAILTRSVAGVFVPMTVVLASIFGTVGIIFFTGNLFNNLTAMIPNMITAISVADSIHLIAAWLLMRGHFTNRADLVIEVIRKNAMPVLLTTITTAVGFYSLVLNDLTPVKQLGWSMAIGTAIAYFLTMSLVPLLLSLFPHSKAGKYKRGGIFTHTRSLSWASFVIRNRIPIVTSALVLVLVACTGLFYVQVDADQRKMFKQDNPVLLDLIWIEEHLGGTGDLEIIFDSVVDENINALTEGELATLERLNTRLLASSKALEGYNVLTNEEIHHLQTLQNRDEDWNSSRIGVSPKFLQLLEQFEARLREEMAKPNSELSIITDLTSPLDILRKMHQVQNNDNPEFYRSLNESDIPESLRKPSISFDTFTEEYTYTPPQTASTLAAQYYLQYENGARPGETLLTQLSLDRKHFRMQGRGLLCTTQEKQAAIAKIFEIAKSEFPALIASPASSNSISSLSVSGKKTLMDRTGIIVAQSFVKSISVALIVILIIISIFFRSWKLGLVSILPNVLPIIIPLSIFGWFDIIIDGPAIVVAAVALGVCIDDTIHFFTKYTDAINTGASAKQAIAHTIQECGDALTLTSIVLIIGFSTMLMSSFSPNYLMGVLAVSMIALAWLADFIVTPAVLAMIDIRASHSHSVKPESIPQSKNVNAAMN